MEYLVLVKWSARDCANGCDYNEDVLCCENVNILQSYYENKTMKKCYCVNEE